MTCCLVLGMFAFNADPSYAAGEELTGLKAWDLVALMDKGYNIGNTLDATGGKHGDIKGHETSWGNPQINKELIDGIAAAGFNTVRVPITWHKHITTVDGSYDIDKEFLDRVKEVVDWCYEDDLFVIINVHHEEWGNVSDLDQSYEKVGKELKRVWEQVSEYFADYDQHLIFEGMNEPRAAGKSYEWTGTKPCYDAVNYLNSVFVNAVRSNAKGHNPERVLMIPGYAASMSREVLSSITIPTVNGAPAENIAISVHCYSPYDFCLTDNQPTFDPKRSADTSGITSMFGSLKSLFLDNGIPVVLGECGCTNNHDNLSERIKWFDYFGGMSKRYGIPAIVWDNGNNKQSGGECHYYFNRKTGEVAAPELVTAFIYGSDAIVKEATDTVIDFEPVTTDAGTTTYTPRDLGFTSSNLTCQARINHTEGAKLGFSLKVSTSIEDRTAFFNMKGYKNKTVRITAYVCSDEADSVTMGIKDSKETMHDLASVQTGKDFAPIVGEYTLDGEDSLLYFKGSDETTFYVDDISIELADENGNYKTPAVEMTDTSADGNAASDDDPGKDGGSDTENTSNAGNTSADLTDIMQERSISDSKLITLFVLAAATVVVALLVLRHKRKK